MDTVDKKTRSEIMSKIRSKDTKLEKEFYSILLSNGVEGLIKNPSGIFGNPDFISNEAKIAIFLDSCFWHGCPDHCRLPKTNKEYWVNKISRNKKRDEEVNRKLKKEGWLVLRVWEHNFSDDTTMLEWSKNLKTLIQRALSPFCSP